MSFLLCTGGQKSDNWWTCLTRALVSELFMSSLICGHLKFLPPRAEPLRARSMGLCLVGHHPHPLQCSYSHSPGQNATFMFACPRATRLAPRWLIGYVLTNVSVELRRRE